MFKELMPLLRHRAVLVTITSAEDDQIRVNVVPKTLKDDENKALTTPLTIVDKPETLDAELGQALVDFVGSHLQLKNTLAQAKAEMDAAAKAAQAEARNKTKPGAKKDGGTANAAPALKPAQKDAKPAEPVAPPPPRTASLFDLEPVAPAPTSAPAPVPVQAAAVANAPVVETPAEEPETSDEEILSEINEDDEEHPLEEAA